ncbi:hypothetical protein EMEDMD4_740004 [Sinorhizobium medicae]|uniref:Uncharacterized protein n=1 Tax=Sinorhizobium medicae TaxID=110321 RepID=A0A508X7I5_9HYPH|nr:hypothetical protein EMEDMD4_740004 [Sinorhizobium medicae]
MLVSGVRYRRNTYACRPTDECTRPSEELAELKAAKTQRSVTSLRGAFLTFTYDRLPRANGIVVRARWAERIFCAPFLQ